MGWRNTREYRIWRAKVIRRDSVCQVCGSVKFRHTHHKNDASSFPELRFSVDNGVTLCSKHHIMFHTSYKNSFSESCSDKDYTNFIELISALKEEFKEELVQKIKEL